MVTANILSGTLLWLSFIGLPSTTTSDIKERNPSLVFPTLPDDIYHFPDRQNSKRLGASHSTLRNK